MFSTIVECNSSNSYKSANSGLSDGVEGFIDSNNNNNNELNYKKEQLD